MGFFEGLDGSQILQIGLMLVVVALVLRRRRGSSAASDPLATVRRNQRQKELSVLGQLEHMEVRLHDLLRELDGRLATRMEAVQQLLVEVDREIAHLQALRTSPRPPSSGLGPDLLIDHGRVDDVRDAA